jgi:lambda repressor-like predicted transcriptional regulator
MNRTIRKRIIKAGLKMKGLTYVDIARATGCSRYTVSTIINGYPDKKSYRIQKTIALALGKSYPVLWSAPARRSDSHDESPDSIETFNQAAVNE